MTSTGKELHITVVGIGAMGGGMARALLASPDVSQVIGYDRSSALVKEFWEESGNKAAPVTSLKESISEKTNFCILVLVNEAQCQSVCFEGDECLLRMMPPNSCVMLCSTVTATWAKKAGSLFFSSGIRFLDCPISGGPVRARAGELSLFCSGSPENVATADPLLQAMGRDVHIIEGGVGMGSTVKMVHQLLAGVHVCAAAEALALAAKAGLDVHQMYDIVNGAAGASWMFTDRGSRMVAEKEPTKVSSALEIFVKDLDIVHSEAKLLQSPTPVAAAALQQFISGVGIGLGRKDDSQLVKVYENVTGVKVGGTVKEASDGNQVGDYWKLADGTKEKILEVGQEPRHQIVISNEYVRALRVSFPANDTTLAHRHAEDSLYFFLVEGGLEVVNHVKGNDPACDCMDFGEVRFGTHKTDQPLVHKITNNNSTDMLCIDAEVLKQPPVTAAIPLVAEHHELIKIRDKCRVYKLTLQAGESVTVSYPFFFFTVILKPSSVKMEIGSGGPTGISWTVMSQLGDVAWREPVTGLKQTNVGDSVYEVFVAEWR